MSDKTAKPTLENDGYEIIERKAIAHAIGDRNAPAFDPELLARAEQALQDLSGEFKGWIDKEVAGLAERFDSLRASASRDEEAIDAFYRSAHDLRGEAATLGFPLAGAVASSICGIIEAAREKDERLPLDLIGHHVDAVRAIVREEAAEANDTASELVQQLRQIGRKFLAALEENDPAPRAAELSKVS
ncbi:MAG: hypothetical protein AB7O39_00300 [Flavobacteriaceae bacterium]